MSYSEENGQVVLRMNIDDWQILLMMLGALMTFERIKPGHTPLDWENMVDFLNRLNAGNPNYTPYEVGGER